jgi:hypothetical protein
LTSRQETGFAGVYEPYCANISSAADLILTEEDSLMVRILSPYLALSYPIVTDEEYDSHSTNSSMSA